MRPNQRHINWHGHGRPYTFSFQEFYRLCNENLNVLREFFKSNEGQNLLREEHGQQSLILILSEKRQYAQAKKFFQNLKKKHSDFSCQRDLSLLCQNLCNLNNIQWQRLLFEATEGLIHPDFLLYAYSLNYKNWSSDFRQKALDKISAFQGSESFDLLLGQFLYQEGNLVASLKCFKPKPGRQEFLACFNYKLSLVLAEMGEVKQAQKLFCNIQDSVRDENYRFSWLENPVSAFLNWKNLQVFLSEFIKEDKDNFLCHLEKGMLDLYLGNIPMARASFYQALFCKTINPWAHYGLARCHEEQGNPGGCLLEINKAIKLYQENEESCPENFKLLKARILSRMGQFSKSQEIVSSLNILSQKR